MNELDYHLKILERSDDIVLMVPHEDNWSWGSTKEVIKARKAKTLKFCNWIRKQFPHVATEFRFLEKERRRDHRYRQFLHYTVVNTQKHFVAYGLTKNELLMIKLSWVFEQKAAYLNASDVKPGDYHVKIDLQPTPALARRLEAKKAKEAAK